MHAATTPVAIPMTRSIDFAADAEAVGATARLAAGVTAHIQSPQFPCVGARSAVNRHRARFHLYPGLGDERAVHEICADLAGFSDEFPDPGVEPVTFVAMFERAVASEEDFERLLWRHLQAMHDHDRRRFAWDAAVGADPARADFSFSIAGRAFFVVGLSPVSSRLARRAPLPCLVFNFHDQFENLRATGKYAVMQKAVRKRDIDLQGSINPVLALFGDASEARQYSGRAVAEDWKCPFSPHHAG